MSAELVDPFATHEPDLTPDEWIAIRDELHSVAWDDHGLTPECLTEALKVLGEVALFTGSPVLSRMATQCLRRMAYRAKNGHWLGAQTEPAWSLDPQEREVPRG